MTWKPKTYFSSMSTGHCPNCGKEIPLSSFLGETDSLIIKSEDDPVDLSEPNFHCEGCGTDIVVDLELKFQVNCHVFKKQDLTSGAE